MSVHSLFILRRDESLSPDPSLHKSDSSEEEIEEEEEDYDEEEDDYKPPKISRKSTTTTANSNATSVATATAAAPATGVEDIGVEGSNHTKNSGRKVEAENNLVPPGDPPMTEVKLEDLRRSTSPPKLKIDLSKTDFESDSHKANHSK